MMALNCRQRETFVKTNSTAATRAKMMSTDPGASIQTDEIKNSCIIGALGPA